MNFQETLKPSFSVLAFITFLLLSMVLAISVVLSGLEVLVLLILTLVLLIYIAWSSRMKIYLDNNELRVGRAHIERKYLGEVTVLSKDEMALARTRDADPMAHLAIRFWIKSGIKVTLDDDRDPTPYWLISSKRGAELASKLKS